MPGKLLTLCGMNVSLLSFTTRDYPCTYGIYSIHGTRSFIASLPGTTPPLPAFPFVKVSPLLHSIFVDELFDLLSTSEFGVRVNSIYIGAPMHVCWQPCFNCRISSRSPIKHAKHRALLCREMRYNLKRSKSLESLPVQELKQDPYGNGISGVRKCKRQMRCTILGFSDLTPSPCRAPQSGAQQGEVHSSYLTL